VLRRFFNADWKMKSMKSSDQTVPDTLGAAVNWRLAALLSSVRLGT